MVFDGKYSGQIWSSQKHLISGCGLDAFREKTLRPLQQSSPQPRWAGFPVHINKLQGIQAKANKKTSRKFS